MIVGKWTIVYLRKLLYVAILLWIVCKFRITNNTNQPATVLNKVITGCGSHAKFHPATDQLIEKNGGTVEFSVKNYVM